MQKLISFKAITPSKKILYVACLDKDRKVPNRNATYYPG